MPIRPYRHSSRFRKAAAAAILATLWLTVSCSKPDESYVIGVSQCSEDSWRNKLRTELEMSTYFYEGVDVRINYVCAYDDDQVQSSQIDSLVSSGIDLLIVSPNQLNTISPAVDRAFDKGVPVVLFDRKTGSDKYTSFMGADNYQIGEILGEYVAHKLGGKGHIVEVKGLQDSSPAIERSVGFKSAVSKYPDLKIVAQACGDWTEPSGESAMEDILKGYGGPIDCVFGGNDRMACGARKVLKRHGLSSAKTLYVGVDALPGKDGGMQQVKDGVLSVSAIYPTNGDELLQLAMNILQGRPYGRENMMRTSLVTPDNAQVLLLQNEDMDRQRLRLSQMHNRVDRTMSEIAQQRMMLQAVVFIVVVIGLLLMVVVRAYRQKKLLGEQLAEEKEKVERQRDELEMERDKLIEATLPAKTVDEQGGDSQKSEQQLYEENAFMQRFNQVVMQYLSDSDLSVETVGSELGLSRVQLYRRIKSFTGLSPVELIRQRRLERAQILLKDSSLSVAEIAYRVGFSSPSYFTKCYRDQYGKNPTEGR